MDDSEKLLAIKQLEEIGGRLRKLFPQNHPLWNDVFEDIGAAGYYLREAGYCLSAAIATVQGDESEVE